MLFANKNRGVAKEIASEFSAYISVQQFQDMWDKATEDPHGFLYVDFDAREHKFRAGFDKAFVV
jgi:hypothetical protein